MKTKSALAAAVTLVALAGVMLLLTLSSCGAGDKPTAEEDNMLSKFTYYERDGEMVFSGCTVNAEEIVIPAEIDGLPVTSVSDNAFYGGLHWNLERVVLPASVAVIGESAFEGCDSLREINIENVREIGDRAFCGCMSLEPLVIGKNVVKIGERAFGESRCMLTLAPENACYRYENGCLLTADGKTLLRADPDIKTCTFPKSVTAIAPGAFEFTDLERVTIPDRVKEIGAYAFYNCLGLTEIEIPAGITRMEDYTFTYCQNLTSVKLHKGLESIGREAFCDDFRMLSMEVPASVKEIGGCAIGYYYYDGDSCARINGFTLYGTSGSAAERYAKENGLTFRSVKRKK